MEVQITLLFKKQLAMMMEGHALVRVQRHYPGLRAPLWPAGTHRFTPSLTSKHRPRSTLAGTQEHPDFIPKRARSMTPACPMPSKRLTTVWPVTPARSARAA